MRVFRSSILALMLSAASVTLAASAAQAQMAVDIRVNIAPPPLPFYEQPVIPAEGYLWVPGYWAWDAADGDYYWVPGTWVEPPQPELLWTPAWWGWVDGRYVFYPGYWGREVGFYGGIDYGYGYTGEGYYGGRWDHGAFFYNRSVNNVASVRITNVYERTVVVNVRTNASFNGGNGGTTARPTPKEEAIARERHVEATPVQRQQAETASKDRSLFSKQNHGEPAVAATPRAGVFQGAGVSRGSRTPLAAKSGNEGPGAERPGPGMTKQGEPPARAGENPGAAQPPRPAPPMANEKEAPKGEERTPPRQPSATEEQRRPTEERPKAEEQRPPEPPRAQEQRPPAQEPPRVQEQRPPTQQQPPREEQRMPAPAPHPQAAPPRPAGPAPRPPAEERK
jgi:WXXGXW repeat (2 copies)